MTLTKVHSRMFADGKVSVNDFGAVGDGVTDDTDAINAALSQGLYVYLNPSDTYYIGGGTNSVMSEAGDTVNDGLRIRSNTIFDGNGATLISDKGGPTPTSSDQFRIITNYLGGVTSENIVIKNMTIKHAGAAGYYTNGIWINGGETSNPENFVNNITIDNINFINTRVGIVVRDNKPSAPPISTNDIRQCSNIIITRLRGTDVTSAVVAPDGNNIIINDVISDHSGAVSSYDTISMVRGHDVTITNIQSKGLINGYGVLIRNRTGSNTKRVQVSNVICLSGKGVKIGTDGVGTTEATEDITFENIHVEGGSFAIDKSTNTMSVDRINLNNIYVKDGTTLDLQSGYGLRVFALTSAGTGAQTINVSNLTVENTVGEGLLIQESQDINVSNFNIQRADALDNCIQLAGDCSNINFSNGNLNTGLAGVRIQSASATMSEITFRDMTILNCTNSITSDSSESGDTVLFENVNVDSAITYNFNFPENVFTSKRGYGSNLTIASGVITASYEYHKVDTEAGAASDDLDTINGIFGGQKIVLSTVDTGRDVVVKHLTGNIRTASGSDVTLGTPNEAIELIYDGNVWLQI